MPIYRLCEPGPLGLRFSSGVFPQQPPAAPQLPGGELERGLRELCEGGCEAVAGPRRRLSLAMSGLPTLTARRSSTKSSMPR